MKRPIITIPDLSEGQIWQCRDQSYIGRTALIGNRYEMRFYNRSEGGSGYYHRVASMTKVENTLEGAWRIHARKLGSFDAIILLYDPKDF